MASERNKMRALPRKLVAVDFDSRQIRIVSAERTGSRMRVREMTAVDVPEGTDVSEATAMGRALGTALKGLGLSGSRVLMNVARGQAVLKPVNLPQAADESELASMVQFQIGRELPFRPEEAVIDFTRESHYHAELSQETTVQGQQVLVAAVTVPVVDYFRTLADAAGVKLLRLGLRSYSNTHCVRRCSEGELAGRVALVHITADETEIDIIEESSLTFSRSAFVKVPPPDQAPPAQLDKTVGSVAMEVLRSLQSYQAAEREGGIRRLYVAGATGIEGRVVQRLSQRLQIDCAMFLPGKALGLQEDPGTSAFVSALGLALAPAPDESLAFDFLNPKKPVPVRDVRKIRIAAAAVAGAVLVAAAATWAVTGAVRRSVRIGDLTDQYNKLEKEHREVLALEKRLKTVQAWEQSGAPWLDHWAQLSAVLPGPEDAYVRSITTNADGSMSLVVRAKSAAVITDIGRRLARAGYRARPGQVSTSNDRQGYVYGTTVRVEVDPKEDVLMAKLPEASRPADDASGDRPTPSGTAPPSRGSQVSRRGSSAGGASGGSSRNASGQGEEPRDVKFDAFAPGAANGLNNTNVQFEANFGEKKDVYLLPNMNKEGFACVELLERTRDGTPRAILAYVDRKSRTYRYVNWMFGQKDRYKQTGIRFRGRATYVPQGWQASGGATACPVALVIESVRSR